MELKDTIDIYDGLIPSIFDLKTFATMIIFGKIRSGKTMFLIDIYNKYLRKKFNEVYVFVNNKSVGSKYKQMEENANIQIYSSEIKETRDMIAQLYNDIKDMNDKSELDEETFPKRLIIIDDLFDTKIESNKGVNDLFLNGRHEGISTIFISQYTHIMVKPIMKSNTDIMAFFKTEGSDISNVTNIIYEKISTLIPWKGLTYLKEYAFNIYMNNILANNDGLFKGLVSGHDNKGRTLIMKYIPKIKKKL